jgi:hypothetical protein
MICEAFQPSAGATPPGRAVTVFVRLAGRGWFRILGVQTQKPPLLAAVYTSVGLLVGVATNNVSGWFTAPRLVAATAVLAVVAVGAWVRHHVPQHAALVRWLVWAMTGCAALAATVTVTAPPQLAAYSPFAVALFALGAVLPLEQSQRTWTTLAAIALIGTGIALIGIGIATIGTGATFLVEKNTLAAITGIGLGIATIGTGIALLRENNTLNGIAGIGLGIATIGTGIALLRENNTLYGIATIGAGAAFLRANTLYGIAVIGFGIATIGAGATLSGVGGRVVGWVRGVWGRATALPAEVPSPGPDDEKSQADATTARHPDPRA